MHDKTIDKSIRMRLKRKEYGGGLDRVKIVAYDRFTKSTKHPRVAGSWLSKIYLPLSNADKYRPLENNFTVICLGEIETEAFQSLADIRAR